MTETLSALDGWVAPGLRLWMLIALVSGVLIIMVVIVCCFMRIRIPRTKRQIDLIAAKRKMRSQKAAPPMMHDERSAAIVMNSMPQKPSASSAGGNNGTSNRAGLSSTDDKAPLVQKNQLKTQTMV